MQADVLFDFARAYDINTVDVVKGQKFSIITDLKAPSRWFSDNDAVLSMNVTDNSADVEATTVGSSLILITGIDLAVIKKITINVVSEILKPAVDLGLTAGVAVPK